MCFRIGHRLGRAVSLNRLKRIGTIQCVFSEHNGVKLEVNNGNLRKVTKVDSLKRSTKLANFTPRLTKKKQSQE